MRTSEAMKIIKSSPELYLLWLKKTKGTGRVDEHKNGKIWRVHRVKNGIDNYTVYDPTSKNSNVLKKGIAI